MEKTRKIQSIIQDVIEGRKDNNEATIDILALFDVGGSLPLDKLYQWCKEEGYKVCAQLTVRADNIRPVIVECDSISSVEDFAEHIGNDR